MKTKKPVKLGFLVILSLVILGGVSCKPETDPEPEVKQFTVTFDADNGTEITTVAVKEGEKVTKPDPNPEKEGFYFDAWYSGENPFDFDTLITANITLKAHWSDKEIVKHKVTVKITGVEDTTVEDTTIEVNDGTKITEEQVKAKVPTDCNYAGTFTDSSCAEDKKFDFETAITADTTIYVKVEKKATEEPPTPENPDEPTEPSEPVKTPGVLLKNSNVYTLGIVDPNSEVDENGDATAVYNATENEDGSITFTVTGKYSGGGIGFYLNEDKSKVDLKDYSKVKIVLSSKEASTPVVFDFFVNDKPDNYMFSKTIGFAKYGSTSETAEEFSTIEWDLTEKTASSEDALEVYAIMVKYNGFQKPAGEKKTFTVKSIELIK